MGLPGAPRIKFLKADPEEQRRKKNESRQARLRDSDDEDDEDGDEIEDKKAKKKDGVRTKYDRMFERQNQDILAEHNRKLVRSDDVDIDRLDGEQASDDDLFAVKRRIPAGGELSDAPESDEEDDAVGIRTIHIPGAKTPLVLDSKRREKLLKSKKKLTKLKDKGQKLVFDDDGNAHQLYELENEDDFRAKGEAEEQRQKFLQKEAERAAKADVEDKALAKEKRRAKREKKKEKEKSAAQGSGDESEDGGVGLEDARDDFAKFLNDVREDDSSDGESEEDERPSKKPKWFQEKGKRKDLAEQEMEIESFGDLEAAAAAALQG